MGALVWRWNDLHGWPLGTRFLSGQGEWAGLPIPYWLGAGAFPISLMTARVATQWLWARQSSGTARGLLSLLSTATLALLPQLTLDTWIRFGPGWYGWARPRWVVEGLVLDWLPGLWLAHVVGLLIVFPLLLDKYPRRRLPSLSWFFSWVGWNFALLGLCVGRIPDSSLALLLAPTVVISVWAFHNGRHLDRGEG